jgi:hypothetical protein
MATRDAQRWVNLDYEYTTHSRAWSPLESGPKDAS